jgi:hypothetical protein
MKAAKKCGPTRGMRSMRLSVRRLRRLPRNLLQNPLELKIPLVSPVVPKRVFVKVGLQVLGAHVVVHAADSPLYQAPESFNRLSVNVARDIDAARVPNAPMHISMRVKAIVGNVFVGKNGAGRKDIFLRQTVKSFAPCIGSNARHDATMMSRGAAFDHAHDRNFVTAVGWPSLTALPTPLAAVVHLIHLHRRTLQLHSVFGEQRANLFEHAPCGLVGDASFALNLFCGDAATSGTHEVHGVEPSLEGSGALLKDGPGQRIDMVSARLAGIGGAARNAVMLALHLALLALSDAIWPALLFDVFEAGIIVRKFGVKIRHCVPEMFWYALFGLHGTYRLPKRLTCCQGIIAFCKSGKQRTYA